MFLVKSNKSNEKDYFLSSIREASAKMGSTDQFNIRWNNYTSVLQNVFRKLLEGEQFVDVTLACEGQSIKCHRLILSACSTYFDRILSDNPTSNLVIYLKDMKFWELRALVTFMYNGEVSISQQKLPHLCKAAEALKVKGLAHDTGLADGDAEKMAEDGMDDFHADGKDLPQRENRRSPVQGQQKSLLRQHNNLSAFAAAAAAANRQPQQFKRKILSQPPKLVKMQRVEKQNTGPGNNAVGSVKPQLSVPTSNKMQIKKSEQEVIRSAPVVGESQDDADDDAFSQDATASSLKDELEIGDNEEVRNNGDLEGGDENDLNSLASDGEDSQQGQTGRPNKVVFKYGKEVRDSALTALQSGMTLRQCSEAYGIPKKTLSKWKSREMKNEGEEDSNSPNRSFRGKEEGVGVTTVSGNSGIVLPPKTTMGAPVDSADRAERLKKATELALSGVTVRQAAAHYEIPRTTLCAYMKRRGLAAKRSNFFGNNGAGANNAVKRIKSDNGTESNGQIQGGNSSHYEDFPFLGISELMDEMGQGNYEGEAYAEGEEEYSEK